MNKYVKDTCKIGQGNDCCRYLVAGGQGFECAKFTSAGKIMDVRAEANISVAQGDNCEGYQMEESIKILNDA